MFVTATYQLLNTGEHLFIIETSEITDDGTICTTAKAENIVNFGMKEAWQVLQMFEESEEYEVCAVIRDQIRQAKIMYENK